MAGGLSPTRPILPLLQPARTSHVRSRKRQHTKKQTGAPAVQANELADIHVPMRVDLNFHIFIVIIHYGITFISLFNDHSKC